MAVVQVQPVPQRRALPEFVAAAHDVEIQIAVTVGVEQRGIHVFVQTVGAKRGFGCRQESAVRVLQEHRAGLPFRAPDVDIVPAIAVDIADGERGPLGREQVGHQRLAAEVKEGVLRMLVADCQPIGDVGKHGRFGG